MTTLTDVLATRRKAARVTPTHYLADGVPYVRVTTALGIINEPWLAQWRGSVGNAAADERRDETATLGKLIHKYCVAAATGALATLPPPDEQVSACLGQFQRWADLAIDRDEQIAAEQTVYHEGARYAGTLDLLVTLKGDSLPSVVDIKTGTLSPVHWLQVAAYRYALAEYGIQTERSVLLHIPRDGGPASVQSQLHNGRPGLALAALNLWRYMNEQAEQAAAQEAKR